MNKRHIAVTVLLLLVSVAFMNGYANDDLFHVEGNILHMNGDINSDTPDLLIEALESNPHVQEIIMHEVPGSLDDDSNLAAARVVREQGLRTRVLPDSMIASGGVDFFLAGTKRYVAKGAMIGVHSWGDGATMEGRNLPRTHLDHQLYLEYYRAMQIPEAFYWFTLEAASSDNIHFMTEEEIQKYHIAAE